MFFWKYINVPILYSDFHKYWLLALLFFIEITTLISWIFVKDFLKSILSPFCIQNHKLEETIFSNLHLRIYLSFKDIYISKLCRGKTLL